jgi:hypothetical protein
MAFPHASCENEIRQSATNRACGGTHHITANPIAEDKQSIPFFSIVTISLRTISHGKGVPSYDRILIDAFTASSESFVGVLFVDDINRKEEEDDDDNNDDESTSAADVALYGCIVRHIRRQVDLCISNLFSDIMVIKRGLNGRELSL